MNNNRNYWLDGMMGLVIGDALGCPVQFLARDVIRIRNKGPVKGMETGGVFNMPPGTWTDDSSMALATLVSIIDKGEIDPKDIMSNFVKWEVKGEYTPFGGAFDQGRTCLNSIYKFIQTGDVNTCGATGEYANGNGALMRILPTCLYYYDRFEKTGILDDEAIEGIHIVSGLTHNHLRSKMCCGFYYFCIKSILNGIKQSPQSKPLIKDLVREGIEATINFYSKDISNLSEMEHLKRMFEFSEFVEIPESGIKSSGYVIDTIEAAIWSLVTTDSFKDCLLKAVNLGDDADTVGAIAGGLAGLYYGYDEIPEEWLSVIAKRDWIEDLCDQIESME